MRCFASFLSDLESNAGSDQSDVLNSQEVEIGKQKENGHETKIKESGTSSQIPYTFSGRQSELTASSHISGVVVIVGVVLLHRRLEF